MGWFHRRLPPVAQAHEEFGLLDTYQRHWGSDRAVVKDALLTEGGRSLVWDG